jgi:GSH-dependent disulfide-bond oxidoreductase
MSEEYIPPKVWTMKDDTGGKYSSINRPTAGARIEKSLPQGKHPFQLYSLATPNGVKVTIMFEELLAAGFKEAEYDAFMIDINEGAQFSSGFVEINPNSKIPALLDKSGPKEIRIFESGSILLYLAQKFNAFLPMDAQKRAETLSWLFWQVGSGPYIGGGFGHFYNFAQFKIEYAIDRFAMETKRQLDVLDKQLADKQFIIGDEYTIADMAIFPWYGALVKGKLYDCAEFLAVYEYENIIRWAEQLLQREAVLRGRLVNRTWGGEDQQQLVERHSMSDFKDVDISFK